MSRRESGLMDGELRTERGGSKGKPWKIGRCD